MADKFSKHYPTPESPATDGFVIASSDAANAFPYVTTSLYVGVTGNVHVRFADSQANCLFQAVPAGATLYIRIDKVWATSTTANGFVGLT